METDRDSEGLVDTCSEPVECARVTPGDPELVIFEKALGDLGKKVTELRGKFFAEFQSAYDEFVNYVVDIISLLNDANARQRAGESESDGGVCSAVFLGHALTYIKALGINDMDKRLSHDVAERMRKLGEMH
jgi:hypothetical protein